MALAYESVQTSNSGSNSVTVTKPVSLAVGDLMVAHIASSNASGTTISGHTLSGWTQIATIESAPGGNDHRATALYKFATSGDVAAYNFTFSTGVSAESTAGAVYRFSGAALVSGAIDEDPTSTANHTFTNTLTPTYANCIMLFLASCENAGGTSFSSYAITTNNPTWTERYDIANTAASGDTTLAGATASRPEVTATGNSTVDTGATVSATVGIIVAVYPIVDVTVSPTVVTISSAVQAPAVSGGANVSTSVISMSSSVQAPTVSSPASDWRNPDKSAAGSITNIPKS